MNPDVKLELTLDQLQGLMNSAVKAFIDAGKYLVSKREAIKMFGELLINTLITNKMLKDYKQGKTKSLFLVSDIIAGKEALSIK